MKGIIYYTDCDLDETIAGAVRDQLLKCAEALGISIVSSSLKKMAFGDKNIHFPSLKKGRLTMFWQIIAGLENSLADIIFFAEHDCLYHPSHFDFSPKERQVYYYNTNVWKVRWSDGFSVKVDNKRQMSGLCGYRDFLLAHFHKKVQIIIQRQREALATGRPLENEGMSRHMGFEPGMHTPPRGVDDFPTAAWRSIYPILDIRHGANLTKDRWLKSQFPHPKDHAGWTQTHADKIPGWKGFYSHAQNT